MALGDKVKAWQSVAVNAYLDIKPAAGINWIINDLTVQGLTEFGFAYNAGGTVYRVPITDLQGPVILDEFKLHPQDGSTDYECWYYLKNIDTTANYLGYSGKVTAITSFAVAEALPSSSDVVLKASNVSGANEITIQNLLVPEAFYLKAAPNTVIADQWSDSVLLMDINLLINSSFYYQIGAIGATGTVYFCMDGVITK